MNHRLVDPLHKKESLIKSDRMWFQIKPIRIAWKFSEQRVNVFFIYGCISIWDSFNECNCWKSIFFIYIFSFFNFCCTISDHMGCDSISNQIRLHQNFLTKDNLWWCRISLPLSFLFLFEILHFYIFIRFVTFLF